MTRYIGKQPAFGNFVKLDAISVVNGQSAYTMQSGSSNFTNYDNVNQFIVSLNGVIQAPTDSFTVSGSTITFASALSTGDVINFILVLGDVLSIGTPSDNTISASKLQTNSVIEAKIQNDAVTRDKINAISTSSLPSFEAKGDGSSVEGKIQLNCHVNSHGVILQSPPHSSGQSYTIKLPDNQIAADKFIKIKSITGSGSTAVGQAEFADAGGGKVLQAVTGTSSTASQGSETSFTDTGLNVTITPSSSSSKILIMAHTTGLIDTNGHFVYFTIERQISGGSDTNIGDSSMGLSHFRGDSVHISNVMIHALDSPSTTSAITYEFQRRVNGGSGAAMYQNVKSNITALEISA